MEHGAKSRLLVRIGVYTLASWLSFATFAQNITATRSMSPELAKALLQDSASVNRLTAEGKLLHESNPNPMSWGQYCGAAWLLNEQGELRRAIRASSMALFVGSRDVYSEAAYAFAKRDLAISYSYSGNLELAEKFANESIAHNAGSNQGQVWSVSYKTLGDVAMRRGDYPKAIEHYRKAENYSSITWRRLVRVSLANAFSLAGRQEDASAMLKEVSGYSQTPVREMVARLVGEAALRAGRHDEAIKQFREYAAAAEKEDGDYHRAWALDGEARALLAKGDQVAGVAGFLRASALAESVRARFRSEEFKTGMFGEMEDIFARTVVALTDAGQHERAFQVAESARARALIDQIRGRVEGRNGVSAFARPQQAAFKVEEVRALLAPDDVLVEYFVAEDQTVAWIFDAQGLRIAKVPIKRDELRKEVQRFRTALVDRNAAIRDSAARLHQILIKPIGPIAGRNLVIVPHDSLHHIPFQALWDGERYMLAANAISYAPSTAVLVQLANSRNASRPRQLVAFGNPDLGNDSLALPGAEREVQNIKAIFPNTVAITGAQATKQRFVAEVPRNTMIHVAAHAEFDDVDPVYSRLRLASEKGESGFLTAREVYGLDFGGTSLVTLSACESGMTRITRGDEIWGFARSFLAAGAPTLVLSLWPVADDSTEKLMTAFYKQLVNSSLREAMQKAQIEVSRIPGFEHPFFWAPFNLTGDWR